LMIAVTNFMMRFPMRFEIYDSPPAPAGTLAGNI
jgi:hypothetical protein